MPEYIARRSDAGRTLEVNDENPNINVDIVIPNDSNLNFDIGSQIKFFRTSNAPGFIVPQPGVELEASGVNKNLSSPVFFLPRESHAKITKIGENKWFVDTNANMLQTITFNTGGVIGRIGPTRDEMLKHRDIISNAWLTESSIYDINDGIQTWKVPYSGYYRIEARGAQGGNAITTNSNEGPLQVGGRGAVLRGVFYLERNQLLNIVVGHRGMGLNTYLDYGIETPLSANPPVTERSGGGGGSFVWYKDSIIPLIAAGGGGGASGDPGDGVDGVDGTLSTSGTRSSANSGTEGRNGSGGRSGNGQGGGGAGFFGDGISGRLNFRINSGHSILRNYEPALGGSTDGDNVDGGFGGGGGEQRIGSTSADSEGCGGGGGYSGGAGANTSNDAAGGGGGSFFHESVSSPETSDGTWTNQAYLDGEERPFVKGYNGSVSNLNDFNLGDGVVIITRM